MFSVRAPRSARQFRAGLSVKMAAAKGEPGAAGWGRARGRQGSAPGSPRRRWSGQPASHCGCLRAGSLGGSRPRRPNERVGGNQVGPAGAAGRGRAGHCPCRTRGSRRERSQCGAAGGKVPGRRGPDPRAAGEPGPRTVLRGSRGPGVWETRPRRMAGWCRG